MINNYYNKSPEVIEAFENGIESRGCHWQPECYRNQNPYNEKIENKLFIAWNDGWDYQHNILEEELI